MAEISTLISDIYELIRRGSKNEPAKRKDGWFTDELASELCYGITSRLREQFSESQRPGSLRLSKMGKTCPRALWYSVHHPELAEPLPAWAEIKYGYGHILEVYLLTLAKAAGHSVEGEQDELVLDGVVGHRDCVLDGYIVDIKSCSSRMFNRFKDKSIRLDDSFGYLDQLDGYTVASSNDPLVRFLDKAYILAIDKQLGHLCLYEHWVRHEQIQKRIEEYKKIVGNSNPPDCTCGTIEYGKSGNRCLDVKASYSQYKHCCFPSLRTFLYSDGPVYLTKVVKTPDVLELKKH